MDIRTLNRDIKRLYRQYEFARICTKSLYEEENQKVIKEYKRLYNVDNSFECMNKKSILIMLKLNLKLNIIPLHEFGIYIKIL